MSRIAQDKSMVRSDGNDHDNGGRVGSSNSSSSRAREVGTSIKAIILVGGPSRGTRFRPLSLDVPKPLFEVAGHPIIEHCVSAIANVKSIKKLFLVGYFKEFVFHEFLERMAQKFKDLNIEYLHEHHALGTAGGLHHFRETILEGNPEKLFVLNADVCCSFPLGHMLDFMNEKTADAVILGTRIQPKQCATNFGCIVSDANTNKVLHYVEKPELFISNLINCGVYLFTTNKIFPAIAKALQRKARQHHLDRFNVCEHSNDNDGSGKITDYDSQTSQMIWLEHDVLSDVAETCKFYVLETSDFWRQIKSAGSAIPANALYLQQAMNLGLENIAVESAQIQSPVYIHPTATVHATAKLGPNVSIGSMVTIEAGVRIKDAIVLEGVTIKHDSCVMHAIVGWNSQIGAWARVEGSPASSPSQGAAVVKQPGVKAQDIAILGKECVVRDEVHVRNCVCLPYKELKRDVANEVIM